MVFNYGIFFSMRLGKGMLSDNECCVPVVMGCKVGCYRPVVIYVYFGEVINLRLLLRSDGKLESVLKKTKRDY